MLLKLGELRLTTVLSKLKKMNNRLLLFFFSLLLLFVTSFVQAKSIKILVFSKTNGFRHKSIPAAKEALIKMANQQSWVLTFTEDSLAFNEYKSLKQYKAVVFLMTTGKVLGTKQEEIFQKYIEKGGGLITLHTGTDCEMNWDWYMNTIGGKFKNHPKQQQAKFLVEDSTHPSTKSLPRTWMHFDEIYNFVSPVITSAHILISVDETSYSGGTMGNNHPIAWYDYSKKGRVFQTALGHTDNCYVDKDMLAHVIGGINWAMGIKH